MDRIDLYSNKLYHDRVTDANDHHRTKDAEHVMCIGIPDQPGMNTHPVKYRNGRDHIQPGVNEKVTPQYYREFELLNNEIRQNERASQDEKINDQNNPPGYCLVA